MASLVAGQLLEQLPRLAVRVLLILRVGLDRLALADQRLKQVVRLIVDRALDLAARPIVMGGTDRHRAVSPKL